MTASSWARRLPDRGADRDGARSVAAARVAGGESSVILLQLPLPLAGVFRDGRGSVIKMTVPRQWRLAGGESSALLLQAFPCSLGEVSEGRRRSALLGSSAFYMDLLKAGEALPSVGVLQ